MSQTKTVNNHFNKAYTLTPREARANYRIESLSSVVSKLNKELLAEGMRVVKTWKMDVTGAKYAEYCRKTITTVNDANFLGNSTRYV
jgi:hypothetical protein